MKNILRKIRFKLFSMIEQLYWRSLTTKYLLDTPKGEYQPFPFDKKLRYIRRYESTVERWGEMKPIIGNENVKSLKDIGSCMGFFCHKAAEVDIQSFGFDRNLSFISISNLISKKMKLTKPPSFSRIEIKPDTICYLPRTDATLLLSVWHHWYFEFGEVMADKMLLEVWEKTQKVLIFESGEEEIWAEFEFPDINTSAKDWLLNKLESLPGGKVQTLGTSSAAAYEHYEKTIDRTLFIVSRSHA
jgi:hypothetical protein